MDGAKSRNHVTGFSSSLTLSFIAHANESCAPTGIAPITISYIILGE